LYLYGYLSPYIYYTLQFYSHFISIFVYYVLSLCDFCPFGPFARAFIHIYTFIFIYLYLCLYIPFWHVLLCIYTFVCLYIYIYIFIFISLYTFMCVCLSFVSHEMCVCPLCHTKCVFVLFSHDGVFCHFVTISQSLLTVYIIFLIRAKIDHSFLVGSLRWGITLQFHSKKLSFSSIISLIINIFLFPVDTFHPICIVLHTKSKYMLWPYSLGYPFPLVSFSYPFQYMSLMRGVPTPSLALWCGKQLTITCYTLGTLFLCVFPVYFS